MTLELRLPGRSAVWAAVMALLVGLGPSRPAAGLTPNSPEVRKAIDKAVKYLESGADDDTRIGARAVVGLALVKYGSQKNHPKIVQAVGVIREALEDRVP